MTRIQTICVRVVLASGDMDMANAAGCQVLAPASMPVCFCFPARFEAKLLGRDHHLSDRRWCVFGPVA